MFSNVIDTPEFQRLRHIRQTSYTPLFSSALHNRFVHSIGVYHLGKMAMNAVKKSIEDDEAIKKMLFSTSLLSNSLDNIQKSFCIACLLHDVGHSPGKGRATQVGDMVRYAGDKRKVVKVGVCFSSEVRNIAERKRA